MKTRPLEWWQSQRPEAVGKETEKLVEEFLKEWNKSQGFAYYKLPDSKTSRGLIKAQISDFMFVRDGIANFLEVKALKHAYRLPKDRVSQLPLMKKFAMAGAKCHVIVHHYMEGVWRVLDAGCLDTDTPSWDLREIQTHSSVEEAMETIK